MNIFTTFAFNINFMKENIAKGVITELLGKKGQDDKFATFLESEVQAVLPPISDKRIHKQYDLVINELATAKEYYRKLLDENLDFIQKATQAETLISQFRCQLTIIPKFNKIVQKRKAGVKTYLVARAPFFEPSIKRNEIKVYLGELKDFGTDIKKIEKDPIVISRATFLLFDVMNKRMGNALMRLVDKKPSNMNVKDYKFFRGFQE